ncbi:hypothetical protein BGZ52_010823 [Haplosporangium bisporale]|nr:hypothetical protein BGZ52_010823 [Haplosporangium bisporale]KAI9238690.1 MAG: subunit 17 of mediator complex-domain-containing protein [Podila humilis]KFH63977.1 hypothetical protein MVEG_09802 [Podila verticillata NRRL 6337]
MSDQPEQKRIKLFLERSIERLPYDITDKGEELYIPDGDPSEKLKRKIRTIVDLAGDHYDDFTENLPTAQEQGQDEHASEGVKNEDAITESVDQPSSTPVFSAAVASVNPAHRVTTPQGVYGKLWHAQGEIRIALDVLTTIIASYQVGNNIKANQELPLPPGTLKCEYVTKATVPLSSQISSEKLALGSKKNHLRKASQILMQGAENLKKVMENEDQFWEGALRLRKNNWSIGSRSSGSAHRINRHAAGSQLSVYYGFGDVGSLHGDRSYAVADLVRSQVPLESDTANSNIELFIPNQTGKVVVVSLIMRGTEYCRDSHKDKPTTSKKTLHSQLLSAQSSLFDAELFQDLVREARIMTNSVSIVDNEIFLPINDELELKISHRKPTDTELSIPSTTNTNGIKDSQLCSSLSGTADIFRYAMQLIQHRRYRQNIKERSDSFFKGSRPGSGRAPGSFRQFQIALAQRPTNMLSTALQTLQYYTFSRRIREVLTKVSRNLGDSWWEPVSIHSVDIKPPTPSPAMTQGAVSSGSSAPVSGLASTANKAPNYSMGAAVSIRVGQTSPSLRFVVRSYPAPCVVFHLPDRPTQPITHITEFEKTLEQELAVRAIRKICEIVNSIESWTGPPEGGMPSPRFVIDIDKRCVGVFQIPVKVNGYGHSRPIQSATVILQLCMKSGEPTTIGLTCTQGGASKTTRLHLEDELRHFSSELDLNADIVHPYDDSFTFGSQHSTLSTRGSPLRSTEGFRSWIQQKILDQMDL